MIIFYYYLCLNNRKKIKDLFLSHLYMVVILVLSDLWAIQSFDIYFWITAKTRGYMWIIILSGLRMFIFTPFILIMAITGILVYIIQDLILEVFNLIWNQVNLKFLKVKLVSIFKIASWKIIMVLKNIYIDVLFWHYWLSQ